MKEKQSLEVNLLAIRRINRFGDLIEIQFMLINATMDLIEEKSKFENQFVSRLQ